MTKAGGGTAIGREAPLPVTRPHLPPLPKVVTELEKIWKNRILSNRGGYHQALEEMLCDYLKVRHVTLLANGTLALMASLKALRLPAKGEVITTPFTYAATVQAIIWQNLTPVFIDIDPETKNLDPEKLEAAISEKTVAIVPVHCYGVPCDIASIEATARSRHLPVIYDAAQLFGSSRNDAALPSFLSFGDYSVLSFHATKVFNTFEGGAIISATAENKAQVDRLASFGMAEKDVVTDFGMNAKFNEFSAMIGLLQLDEVEEAIEKRLARARRYDDAFFGARFFSTLKRPEGLRWNGAYYPIFLHEDAPCDVAGLVEALRAEDIHCRQYFHPLLSDIPFVARQSKVAKDDRLTESKKASRGALVLPLFPDMHGDDLERVCSVIDDQGLI